MDRQLLPMTATAVTHFRRTTKPLAPNHVPKPIPATTLPAATKSFQNPVVNQLHVNRIMDAVRDAAIRRANKQ